MIITKEEFLLKPKQGDILVVMEKWPYSETSPMSLVYMHCPCRHPDDRAKHRWKCKTYRPVRQTDFVNSGYIAVKELHIVEVYRSTKRKDAIDDFITKHAELFI